MIYSHSNRLLERKGGYMIGSHPETGAAPPDWRKRMSNQVAYALLVYTALQIFFTMGALQGERASLLPYFALVLLVGAIIPACRCCDRRWQALSDDKAHCPQMAMLFRRDCLALWVLALGVPVAMTLLLKLLEMLFAR